MKLPKYILKEIDKRIILHEHIIEIKTNYFPSFSTTILKLIIEELTLLRKLITKK